MELHLTSLTVLGHLSYRTLQALDLERGGVVPGLRHPDVAEPELRSAGGIEMGCVASAYLPESRWVVAHGQGGYCMLTRM
jgi:hypothetical protein